MDGVHHPIVTKDCDPQYRINNCPGRLISNLIQVIVLVSNFWTAFIYLFIFFTPLRVKTLSVFLFVGFVLFFFLTV